MSEHQAGLFTPSKSSALGSIHFKRTDFPRRIDINIGAIAGAVRMWRIETCAIPTVLLARLQKAPNPNANVIMSIKKRHVTSVMFEQIHRCYFGFTEIIFVTMLKHYKYLFSFQMENWFGVSLLRGLFYNQVEGVLLGYETLHEIILRLKIVVSKNLNVS